MCSSNWDLSKGLKGFAHVDCILNRFWHLWYRSYFDTCDNSNALGDTSDTSIAVSHFDNSNWNHSKALLFRHTLRSPPSWPCVARIAIAMPSSKLCAAQNWPCVGQKSKCHHHQKSLDTHTHMPKVTMVNKNDLPTINLQCHPSTHIHIHPPIYPVIIC